MEQEETCQPLEKRLKNIDLKGFYDVARDETMAALAWRMYRNCRFAIKQAQGVIIGESSRWHATEEKLDMISQITNDVATHFHLNREFELQTLMETAANACYDMSTDMMKRWCEAHGVDC